MEERDLKQTSLRKDWHLRALVGDTEARRSREDGCVSVRENGCGNRV